jgi:hypothetical protein
MPKRLILAATLALALCPATTLADDTAAPPTDTPAPAQVQQDPAAAAGLGPAASAAGAGSSSPATGNMLQGAGSSPLQSTPNDSSGLTAPASNALQAPTTPGETLQVIEGDADGSPHTPSSSGPSHWAWLVWTLIIAIILPLVFFTLRRFHLPWPPGLRLPGRRPH